MFVSKWKLEYDRSFYEAHVSLIEDLTPIFKIRAVKTGNGYMAVVRDSNSGKMLASSRVNLSCKMAKVKAIEKAHLLLKYYTLNKCKLTEESICPHRSVDNEICADCKLIEQNRIK